MTQEKKARAYDKALERARIWQNHLYRTNNSYYANELNYIFPELKESEDEKIRKQILSFLKEFEYDHYRNLDFSSWIAWLEKQESYYSFEIKKGHWYKCVCDYMLNNSDLMFKNDRLYYCRSDWRLRGEIDERNVKNIGVNGYKSFFRPATNQEIKEWLEKQGKQKSTEHNENEEPQVYETNDDDVITYSETNGYKVIEPKFKVGDWISNDMCDVHIASIEDGMYYFDEGDGLSIVFVDEHYHIWTIEDAMDGDVLVSRSPFIYGKQCPYGGLNWCNNKFIKASNFIFTDSPVHPATKEQRDFLFQKMKEAGYEWHINKKELRKKE